MSLNKSRYWWYRHRKAYRRKRNLWWRLLVVIWIGCGALATHQLLQVWNNTNHPILVALSGEYRAPSRGALLIVNNSTNIGIGDTIAFKIRDRDVPIYHRIVTVHENTSSDDTGGNKWEVLTKGDDNRIDDRGLYAPGQQWIERKDLYGKVIAIPEEAVGYLGTFIVCLHDYPPFRVFLLAYYVIQSILLNRSLLLTRRNPLPISLSWQLPSVGSILFFFTVFSMVLIGSVG